MRITRYLETLLILSVSSLTLAENPVYFADPNLEASVEAQLGIYDPMPAHMLGLTTLYSQQAGISDLTGIEHAYNLSELHLWENQISDISSLSALTHLTNLYLWSNQIEDVSPLSGLTGLTVLALPDNQIVDVSSLSGLTNLTQLYLYINQISDISSLSGLLNLEELYLYANQITDVSPLSGLGNLTTLELGGNQISDISSISGLANLTALFLWENQITDVTDLEGLVHLQELYLHVNQITDISPLSGLMDMTKLHLWENQLGDVSPLSGMIGLTELALHDNQIQDVSPLSGLANLQVLYLYVNQITDIAPLSELINLTTLDLADNQIGDITSLSGLMNLTTLELGNNQINDIAPLSGLANLEELYLYANQVSDISSLLNLTKLMVLDLEDNQVSDVLPLSWLANLTHIALAGNQISDISPLIGLTNWEALSLNRNPLSTDAYCTDLYEITDNAHYAEYDPNPNPPDNVTASQGTQMDQVQIAWEPVCNGPRYTTHYQVYRASSLSGARTAVSDWQIETEIVDDAVDASGSTYYWVRAAADDQGSFGLSDYGVPVLGRSTPTPNPMTWAVEPIALGASSISMTATQATPVSGVEYFFDCVTDGGHDSTWQTSPSYLDSGLLPDTQYSYRVKARAQGQPTETDWSLLKSAMTHPAPDATPPSPNPLTWATAPHATGQTSIAMTASSAMDASGGIQYYFDCQTSGGHDSGWQMSATYEDMNLSPNTTYQYRVRARDSFDNQTDYSDSAFAHTDEPAQGAARNEDTGLWSDTVQQAIDAAGANHTIKVYPGIHTGAINFNGKVLTLSSTDPSDWSVVENTVLNGNGAAGFVTLNSNGILDGLTITGCTDTSSWEGAICCTAHTPTIRRCVIRDNQSRASAAVCTFGFASAIIEDCKFLNNSALNNGGALGGDFTISACEFSGNRAGMSGGAVSACTSVSGCTFTNNSAGTKGGALHSDLSDLAIRDCIFSGNSAQEGGAIYAKDSVITNCIIQDNTATRTGGGLYTTHSPVIVGCAILGNIAQTGDGGGIYSGLNRLTLVNCTIKNCSAPFGRGGGVYSYHGLDIKNTILWGNRATHYDQLGGAGDHFYERVHFQSCAIENGSMPYHITDGKGHVIGLNLGGDFVFTDPLFMDTWHLKQNSPCRDQGQPDPALPATDHDGDSRLLDMAVDIGADEIAPDTAVPVPHPLGWWAQVPQASSSHAIVMTAAAATGAYGPIEYYFECQQDGAFNSIWQTERRYEAKGLNPNTEYQFRVKARNRLGNETASSDWSAATTDAYVDSDTQAPTPDPLTWASVPQATGLTTITMTASTALDAAGVEYLFECTAGGGHNSAWQSGPVYTDTGLQANTRYTYWVRARDTSANQNAGNWSVKASATTHSGAGLHGIDVRVSSTVDDAEEGPGGRMDFASPELELVNNGMAQAVGLRFSNVNIPAGVLVVNAYIEFRVGGTETGSCSLSIRGHDTDSAGRFSSFAGLSSLVTTSASVGWSPSPWTEMGAKKRTPDLKSIVQEIVNRSGWSQGNDMAFIITGSGTRVAESYDGGGYLNGPLLHVDFE